MEDPRRFNRKELDLKTTVEFSLSSHHLEKNKRSGSFKDCVEPNKKKNIIVNMQGSEVRNLIYSPVLGVSL